MGILGAPAIACGGQAETAGTGGANGSGGSANAAGGSVSASGGSEHATGGSIQGSGGSASTGGGSAIVACENPMDVGGGFVRCDAGQVHRASPGRCPSEVPRDEQVGDPMLCSVEMGCCLNDADCAEPNQYCAYSFGLELGPSCQTGCIEDADCGAGMICMCGEGPMGQCVPAQCEVDDDCPGDLLCTNWITDDGCGERNEFVCQAPGDECGGPGDCMEGQECVVFEGTRRCQQNLPTCTAGRPFLVAHEIRAAGVTPRSDWIAEGERARGVDSSTTLSDELSERLADYWQHAAQMEHASIAAFARFSLQLLSLGAPAEFIEETNRALVDETRHARACFALSSEYRGEAVGPESLNIAHALSESSAESILVTTILEGCVGETVAALEAAEAAQICQNAKVGEILRGISDDEGRHAELAWKTVRWILTQRPDLAELAQQTFVKVLNALDSSRELESTSNPSAQDAILGTQGMLSELQRREVRDAALRQVVAPCAAQLFAERDGGSRLRAEPQSERRTAPHSSSTA